MKLLALRAKSGEMLIGIENNARESCETLLVIKKQLDSLVNQIADNKYYTENDKDEVLAVHRAILSNLQSVIDEYTLNKEKE